MSQRRQGVLIAIDRENIRRGAQFHQRRVSPDELCRAMREVGSVFGQVHGGKAFGDWPVRPATRTPAEFSLEFYVRQLLPVSNLFGEAMRIPSML